MVRMAPKNDSSNFIAQQAQQLLKKARIPLLNIQYKTKRSSCDLISISDTPDVEFLFRKYWSPHQMDVVEQFRVMYLTAALQVIGIVDLATGSPLNTYLRFKHILAAGFLCNATSIILCHNHPSGSKWPSQTDIKMTRRICIYGNLFELPVQDHLILTTDECYSFAAHGLIKPARVKA